MSATDGLTVTFRKTADETHYEVGVTVEGAWFTFGAFSAPGVEAAIAAAKAATDAADTTEA